MGEGRWDVNGNLRDEEAGLPFYAEFKATLDKVMGEFHTLFGKEIMTSIDFYVDNATKNSGLTPIITPVLKKYLIIKLGIAQNDKAQIAFQFAHELTHYVFYAIAGLGKEFARADEEAMCTAMSLCMVKRLYPDDFERYNQYVQTLDNEGYRNGASLASEVGYDLHVLKARIVKAASSYARA